MGRLTKLGFGSNKTGGVDSLEESNVSPSKKSAISKSASVSEGLSRKGEKDASKENTANAGEVSNSPKQDVESTNDEQDEAPKKSKGTVLNGLARRATVMRQKSLDNIIQASKRISMMPPKSPKARTSSKETQPLQTPILDLPNSLLTDILFRTVFWTTLEFEYEAQINTMKSLSIVCKKFFEAWYVLQVILVTLQSHSTPHFWNRIWHAMTRSSEREKATVDVGDAKSLKKECLKLSFYKTAFRKPSPYSGRHFGNPHLKLVRPIFNVALTTTDYVCF